MKKMFFALAAFMFIGIVATQAQTSTTTKEEVKVESTAPKTCSGHINSEAPKTCSGTTTSTAPKTCCSSSKNTSCSGSTTMTSTDGGKTDGVTTNNTDKDKKNSKNKKNMSSNCTQSPNNKTCCSHSEGHK